MASSTGRIGEYFSANDFTFPLFRNILLANGSRPTALTVGRFAPNAVGLAFSDYAGKIWVITDLNAQLLVVTYTAGRNPWSVIIAGVDGDGNAGMIVVNEADNTVECSRAMAMERFEKW